MDEPTLLHRLTQHTILAKYYETGDPRYRSAFTYGIIGGICLALLCITLVISYLNSSPLERTLSLLLYFSIAAGLAYAASYFKRYGAGKGLTYLLFTAFIVAIWIFLP